MSDAGIQPSAATGLRPVPDPTVLTTEQIERAVAAERDYVKGQLDVLRERLTAIDKATELLNDTVNRTPTDIQKEVTHLRELSAEKFSSVELQFKERDTRSERESRDNKVAVDAAFAAQKEAAAKQDEANQKSIDKSEKATNESINKLGDVVTAANKALSDKIDDVKTRLGTVESMMNGYAQNKAGGQESTRERRDSNAAMYAVGGFVIALILAAFIIVPILSNASP